MFSFAAGIDVLEDTDAIPSQICRPCILKLKRLKKTIRTKKSAIGISEWQLPDFSCTISPESRFQELLSSADNACRLAGFVNCSDSENVVAVQLERGTGDTKVKVEISQDFTWDVYQCVKLPPRSFMLHRVRKIVPALNDFPDTIEKKHFPQILCAVSQPLCTGNNSFPSLVTRCRQLNQTTLFSNDRKTIGYLNGDQIHSTDCNVFVEKSDSKSMCCNCSGNFRNNLRARLSNFEKYVSTTTVPKTSQHSHVRFSYLSDTEKAERSKNKATILNNFQKKMSKLEFKISELKIKLKESLEQDSVTVDDSQHSLLKEITGRYNENVLSEWPEGSLQRVLWEQQVKYCKLKSASGMRWHPAMIRWCVTMYSKSSKAYNQLANSGFLHLPHPNTLKSYINFTDQCPGINSDIFYLLVQEFGLDDAKESKANVAIVWDEIKIKSGLAVTKGTGKVVGFCSTGDLNEELQNLEFGSEKKPQLATHVIVLMVRSLMGRHSIPVTWYPCEGFTSTQLWEPVWKVTHILEDLDFKVRAWICDGATPNRLFFRLHSIPNLMPVEESYCYCTANPYDDSRLIFFICDVPHLLKTVRNNLENSHGNLNSKNLMKNGKWIKWPHIVSTVKEDMSRSLQKLPKLKEEHINLSPQLRMRVRLAAQVLSKSMANALAMRNDPELEETANFCEIIDKWFDCLNGRYSGQEIQTKKPELAAYKLANDWRLNWLEGTFLAWLSEWEAQVMAIPNLTRTERNHLLLSYQTMEGLRITTKSFVVLIPILLGENGAEFILPEKLNQDRLESFFGKIRRSVGDSDNPTVYEVGSRFLALLVSNTICLKPANANVQVLEEDQNYGFQLKKRRLN